MTQETIGDRVKRLRKARGLNQSQLARASGISRSYLCGLESGLCKNPSAEVAYNIAVALKVRTGYLIGREPHLPPSGGVHVSSDSLDDFAIMDGITEADKIMLSYVQYKGKSPESVEDWRYLYETIRRVINTKDRK